MIEIDIKRKAFGESEILRNIKLTLKEGETLALLGPSGIGKTTLLRILVGLDEDFEGSIDRPGEIAMVFQEPTLLLWRTVLENVTLATGVSRETAITILNDVGLADKQDMFPRQLSLGQQRRLTLARAFASTPKLLVMDEPFASLDRERMTEMLALTGRLIKSTSVTTLLVTHSETEAKALSDRIVRLDGQPAGLV